MKEAVRRFKETVEIRSSIFNRLRSHRYFSTGLLIAIILMASCLHIWQRVRVIELAKETARLKTDNKRLADDYKKIYAGIVSLSMSSRIRLYARDTLGMVSVETDNLYTLLRKEKKRSDPDELTRMFSAAKRVAKYMPVMTEATARAGEMQPVTIDSMGVIGGER